jgi:hypothetical protein
MHPASGALPGEVRKNPRRGQGLMCSSSMKCARRQSPGQSKRDASGLAQRQEVLRALDRLLEAAKQLLQIGGALDKIDV